MKFGDLPHEKAAMAIFPCTAGFGWMVFDGPLSPVRWQVSTAAATARSAAEKNRRCLARIEEHLHTFRPAVLVLEEFDGDKSRRSPRIRALCRSIVALATVEGAEVRIITREQVRKCFADSGLRTRHEIAVRVAAFLREISVRLPDKRKVWETEKPDAALMNAAALLIVHYANPREPL